MLTANVINVESECEEFSSQYFIKNISQYLIADVNETWKETAGCIRVRRSIDGFP